MQTHKNIAKGAVRILAFKLYISHSTPIFKTLQILKIEDLYTVRHLIDDQRQRFAQFVLNAFQ